MALPTQYCVDPFGDDHSQFLRTRPGEVDVAGCCKEPGGKGVCDGIQVIDLDAMFFHDARCHGVVLVVVTHFASRLTWRHGCGMRPEQFGPGRFELHDELFQVFLVLAQRCGERATHFIATALDFGFRVSVAEIPQAPVEMNDVPLSIAKPSPQLFQSSAGVLCVAGVVFDLDLASQCGGHVGRVANGDRVAN